MPVAVPTTLPPLTTAAPLQVLLPVRLLDADELTGGALVSLTPDRVAVLLDWCRRAEAAQVRAIEVDDDGPSAFLETQAIPESLLEQMDDAWESQSAIALDPTAVFPIADAPPLYGVGRVDRGRLRAIRGYASAAGIWWTAIASHGDNDEDERVRTGVLPRTTLEKAAHTGAGTTPGDGGAA